jgi:hypothetical protein
MVLPLYLAVTGAEMSTLSKISFPCAYMACHFSPYSNGLANLPEHLPENAILILNDRMRCCGHSAGMVAQQMQDAVEHFGCESVLLDFQRPPEPESKAMVQTIVKSLACTVAVTERFAQNLSCPVFLSPAPLHMPLQQYLAPWQDREVWLEAALGQEDVIITKDGSKFVPQFPSDGLTDGFYDEALCCRYRAKTDPDRISFTLYDTLESLEKKLNLAHSLGVSRAIGLWQELGAP